MSYDQKDLLKFALDLYQKTKGTGLNTNNGLGAILEAVTKINPSELTPSSLNSEDKKNRQENLQNKLQEDKNHLFWKEGIRTPQSSVGGTEQSNTRNVSPISIYETIKDINIQAILPGVVSHKDLHVLISPEVIELYGTKVRPGDSNQVDNFYKIIRLPAAADPSGATATYRNGLLSISISKKEPALPRRVPVRFD